MLFSLPARLCNETSGGCRDPEGLPFLMALLENMKQSLVKICNTSGISVVLHMLTNLHDFPMSPRMLVESQIVTAIKLFKQVQYTYVL